MSDIEIKNAPIALKDRITELCKQTHDAHREAQPFNWPGNHFEVAIRPYLDAAFQDARGKQLSESPTLFIAMKDGDFAGYLRMAAWSTGFGGDIHSGSIEDICVIPEYRGQGIARALIAHARKIAKENDWDDLDAHIAEWNVASKKLFETSGFAVKSQTYRIGPERQARDYPTPSAKSPLSPVIWFLIALTVVNLTVMTVILTR